MRGHAVEQKQQNSDHTLPLQPSTAKYLLSLMWGLMIPFLIQLGMLVGFIYASLVQVGIAIVNSFTSSLYGCV